MVGDHNDLAVARRLMSTHDRAKSRGLECDLGLADIRRLLSTKKCAITGQPFDDKTARTFDRLDNSKGYVRGNVIAVCEEVNQKKGALTPQEIKNIYAIMKARRIL